MTNGRATWAVLGRDLWRMRIVHGVHHVHACMHTWPSSSWHCPAKARCTCMHAYLALILLAVSRKGESCARDRSRRYEDQHIRAGRSIP